MVRWMLLFAVVFARGEVLTQPNKCLDVVESRFCKGLMPLKVCAEPPAKGLPSVKDVCRLPSTRHVTDGADCRTLAFWTRRPTQRPSSSGALCRRSSSPSSSSATHGPSAGVTLTASHRRNRSPKSVFGTARQVSVPKASSCSPPKCARPSLRSTARSIRPSPPRSPALSRSPGCSRYGPRSSGSTCCSVTSKRCLLCLSVYRLGRRLLLCVCLCVGLTPRHG